MHSLPTVDPDVIYTAWTTLKIFDWLKEKRQN